MLKSNPTNSRDIYLQPHIDSAFSRSISNSATQQRERVICRDCKDHQEHCNPSEPSSTQKTNSHASPYHSKPYTLLGGKHFQTPALLASEDELSRENYEAGVNSADSLEFTDRDSVRKNIYFQSQPEQYDRNRNDEALKVSPIKRAGMVSDQESIENQKGMFSGTFDRDEQGYENIDMSKEYFEKLDRINNNFSGVIQRDFSTAAADIVQRQAVKESLLEQENMLPTFSSAMKYQQHDTTRESDKWKTAGTMQREGETSGSHKDARSKAQSPSQQQYLTYDSPMMDLDSKNIYKNENKPQQNSRSALAFKDITRHLRKENDGQGSMQKQRTLLSNGRSTEPIGTKENNQHYLNLEGKRIDTYESNEQPDQDYSANSDSKKRVSHRLQAREYPLENVVSYEASKVEGRPMLDPVELPLQASNGGSKKKILVQDSESYSAEMNYRDSSTRKKGGRNERATVETKNPSAQILELQNEILGLIKAKRIEEALSMIEECSDLIQEDFDEGHPQQM